jgi:hypothetical protein
MFVLNKLPKFLTQNSNSNRRHRCIKRQGATSSPNLNVQTFASHLLCVVVYGLGHDVTGYVLHGVI